MAKRNRKKIKRQRAKRQSSTKTKALREKRRKRKNFFPTLVVIFITWGLIAFIVYFIEPEAFGAVALFFLTVFFAFLLTFSTLFANTRRGVISAVGLALFLILRFFGVGNILNLLLIAGIAISIDYYLTHA